MIRSMALCLIGVLFTTLFTQCDPYCTLDEEQLAWDLAYVATYHPTGITNRPQPKAVTSLRILAIGNSYTQDGCRYLNELVKAAGIHRDSICVYVAYMGGASLDQWTLRYRSGSRVYLQRYVGRMKMKTEGSLRRLMEQHWDIIVFQQYSLNAPDFKTYNPSLDFLTHEAQTYCPNLRMAIAWQQTWTHSKTPDSVHHSICKTVETMKTVNGIDIVIPTGKAIYNARHSILQTDGELTRDGTHLSYGTGCFVAACTWFQALIAPAFGVSLSNNTATHTVTEAEKKDSRFAALDVTKDNLDLCHQCAIDAFTP